MPIMRYKAEQIVTMLRQIEVGIANGKLTPREREILQLVADNKSNKEIASLLNLSTNTVSAHRSNIMKALGTHKTAELVSYAISHGPINIA